MLLPCNSLNSKFLSLFLNKHESKKRVKPAEPRTGFGRFPYLLSGIIPYQFTHDNENETRWRGPNLWSDVKRLRTSDDEQISGCEVATTR